MNTAIKADGARELRRKLRQAGEDVTQLKDLHQRLADDVAGTAKTKVPVRTGRLRDSIKGKAYTSKARVEAGNNRKSGRTAVQYSGPIHFGWSSRNIKPQPFLYEALDVRRQEVIEAYNAQIKQLVNRIF